MKHLIRTIITSFIINSVLTISSLFCEGFLADTLVKTGDKYIAIQDLRLNQSIVTYDQVGRQQTATITARYGRVVDSYLQLTIDDELVRTTDAQLFYLSAQKRWLRANQLKIGMRIAARGDGIVQKIVRVRRPTFVYLLTVQPHHQFCVGRNDIVAHNFFHVAIGFGFAFGGGLIFKGITLSIGLFGFWIGRRLFAKKHGKNSKSYGFIQQSSSQSPMMMPDPDQDKFDRDQRRADYRPLTNQEARAKAKELGFVEDKNPPFKTKNGVPAFKRGNKWITPDKHGHKGGVWKYYFKDIREGTYNIDLTIKIAE